MNKITIREITDNNRNQVIAINANSKFVQSPEIILQYLPPSGNPQVRAIYAGETPIGFAFWSDYRGGICLNEFMIDAKYQGKGLGKQSLICVLDEMKQSGECEIWLMADKENSIAITLYVSIGFKPAGSDGPMIMYKRG